MDYTYEMLKRAIEQTNEIKKEAEAFSNCFEDDIMHIQNYDSRNDMREKTQELLTVISLDDNPTLNLSVAQPSKYKIESTSIGTGIMCYKKNALKVLKEQLNPNEIIIQITIKCNVDRILDLCGTNSKSYLKSVYNSITDKSIIKSDKSFIDYVCKKGVKKYDIISGFIALGKPIYNMSIITDYMDRGYVLKTDTVIIKAEAYKDTLQ